MEIRVGDCVYCHTDGYMSSDNSQFATKGRHYRVTSFGFDRTSYYIKDDRGYSHSFSIENLKNGCRWFSFNQQIVINKPIKKISF